MICFLVSAREGIVSEDLNIAKRIRKYKKNILVLVNKIDGLNADLVKIDFYELGFQNIHAISATNGIGIHTLITKYFSNLLTVCYSNFNKREKTWNDSLEQEGKKIRLINNANCIKVAVIGKPNAGKSTLINSILNTYKMITDKQPGTTRDSIWNIVTYKKSNYIFIDTAGIRKKNKIDNYIEKFSVKKTFSSIKSANVVILMIDITKSLSDQDLTLLNYVIDSGCGIIIVFNKCDKISQLEKKIFIQSKRFSKINIGDIHFISAINLLNINKIFLSINKIFKHSTKDLNTSELTRIMKLAVENHQLPIVQGNRIKLKYAHLGRKNPLTIIIHGNKLNYISNTYKKYLSNFFIKSLKIVGNPIHFYFKNSKNPFLK
ncbi:ribosome biogenesis GTPase Der [Buchnera aphidicola]|uniref:ribosome biogenesis GTPase Der n=1 Tax=Buchnera aphidicola TaxID=9 RepID=UPI000AD95EED|nr:ribosome biogenesis GTPase Der [Buchnera aphidicola]